MSPDNSSHIPIHWRLRKERYTLSGCRCSNCSNNIFPPRSICPNCNYEIEANFFEMGTVKAVLNHKEISEREIEIAISRDREQIGFKLNLNGKSHTLGLEVGMQIPVFIRRSMKGKDPIYSVDVTSLPSK